MTGHADRDRGKTGCHFKRNGFFAWHENGQGTWPEALHEKGRAVRDRAEIFKLGRDDEVWSRFADGEWLQDGPPADIFDNLGYEDFTDWDEDEEEDSPNDAPRGDDEWDWDDDDMNSIYMYDFSPAAMKALTLAGIETVDQIKAMSDGQLAAIPGLDEKDVRRIKKVLSFDR